MATARYTVTLRTAAGVTVSGQSLYLVSSGDSYNTDMPLTENPSKGGEYYRDSVAAGNYDLYRDADKIRSDFAHGLTAIDAGSIDTDQLADGSVTTAKIADGAVTEGKTSFGKGTW